MRTNVIKWSVLLLLFCQSCAKEDADFLMEIKPLSLSIFNESVENDYVISEELLNEYLKINGKRSSVSSIISLDRGEDVLAYFVTYDKGWDLIAADTRIESVLATADNSTDIVLDSSFLEQRFSGILDYVQSVKGSRENYVSRLWSYLQLRVMSKSNINTKSPVARGVVPGMWIEVSDGPEYISEYYVIPHIISSRWYQKEPWNKFMPMNNDGSHYVVGCGPVAAGQVIHHYRKNNSKGIFIPISVSQSAGVDSYPVYNYYSSTHWGQLALYNNAGQLNKDYTSLFLAYLGEQIGVNYKRPDGTGTTHTQMKNALDLYMLNYNQSTSYNYYDFYNSLFNGYPIIVGSEYISNIDSEMSRHYYIVDRYKEITSSYVTSYVWVPDYQPTEWELQTLPQWRFELCFPDGRETLDVIISSTENVYFGMNWGDDGCVDDFYLARTYVAESEDEAGTIPGYEIIYTPSWIVETNRHMNNQVESYHVRNILSVFYNIHDRN